MRIGKEDGYAETALDDETAADFAEMGMKVPREAIAARRYFEVDQDCEQELRIFLKLKTQWRFEPLGKGLLWSGLDYDAVAALLDLEATKKKRKRRLFAAIREMEDAALPVLNGGKAAKGDEPWL